MLAIIAVLMVAAVPSYRASLLRARRIDAHDILFHVAALQERHFFTVGRYASSLNELADPAPMQSREGHYAVSVAARGGGDGFIARAVPLAGSPQQDDRDCSAFSLDDRGERGASGSADAAQRCWR